MNARRPTPFDLRAGQVDALQLAPRTTDLDSLLEALQARLDSAPDFFLAEPMALDMRRLEQPAALDAAALVAWLREHGVSLLGVLGADVAGLPQLHAQATAKPAATPAAKAPEAPAAAPAAPVPTPAPPAAAGMVIDRPLRSGQRIYAPGDLTVLQAVSHGAEVIAGGNIHVYAALRGRALAGAHGDPTARIFCTCFEPELVAIAGVYRTAEQALPDNVRGHAAQVTLHGEQLRIEPLGLK